ncbi:hypothetical protein AVEN_685-2 [Araneus ventricosus]|uniref:Transcription termination and cleavage factor C-terminal domain-containing protein n=1 Tax=Araneus ventricosus TaxID=182803 RepID=A0A4Y2BX82_ARAVE|nr:hypothetical protein AVEN_685-2 [Araneus ventricosus]
MDIPTSYPSALPPSQVNSLPQNPVMTNPRPTQPVMPLTRPALLGERPPLIQDRPPLAPGHPNPILQNPFPERDPRALGDHDLRQMPMSDRDMRPPPMLIGDKDMRQPVGDQDLRTRSVPGGIPDNRAFDPRFRNMQGADASPMTGPPVRPGQPGDIPGFDRSRAGPPYDARGAPPTAAARVDPAAQPAGNRVPPQNPRIAAVGGSSPAVGGASPSAGASPRPSNNSLAAAAAAIAPHDQEKAALIMQVLQLSDQQIAMLPPEQRQSIMILKEQIARSQNLS